MKLRNTILVLSMLGCIPAVAMEMPPQPAIEYYNSATLLSLPNDIKSCLFPMLTSTDIAETEREILVLAATNKKLINSPQVMIAILDDVLSKVRYTAHAVQLAQRLQTRTATLPVMQSPIMFAWLANTRSSLEAGAHLYHLISEGPIECGNPTQLIKKGFKNRYIDLDWQHPTEEYKNPLMRACHDNETVTALLLLGAGASIDWRKNCTKKQLGALEANCPYMKLAIDDALAARKKKLALKQPVKQ